MLCCCGVIEEDVEIVGVFDLCIGQIFRQFDVWQKFFGNLLWVVFQCVGEVQFGGSCQVVEFMFWWNFDDWFVIDVEGFCDVFMDGVLKFGFQC